MASPIAASNDFGVARAFTGDKPFIDTAAEGAPSIQTYSGFAIQVAGVTIGRITEWTPHQMDRTVNIVKELNPATFGQPVDAVPAGSENFQLAFARAEVWGEELERAFGEEDIYTLLTDQNHPFTIDEVYYKGRNLYKSFRYLGCWFSSKNVAEFSATGDNQIKISGDITFVNKIPVVKPVRGRK